MLDLVLSEVSRPSAPGLRGRERVGMPQLALNGLSESWLLADCGDRHWQLLAEAAGVPVSCLRDSSGRRVYPAFRAVRLRHGRLGSVVEDDELEIDSLLGRVSRTQFYSKHLVSNGAGLCAVVEMQSVFIARETAGLNTSAVRSPVAGLEHVPLLDEGLRFAEFNRRVAQAPQEREPDRSARGGHSYAPLAVHPCPSLHFNGAGFLYFARFHELVDQAEWSWLGPRAATCLTTERHLLYHGNADVGSTLSVQLCAVEQGAAGLHHHCQLLAQADKHLLADVFTRRSPRREQGDFLENLFEPHR